MTRAPHIPGSETSRAAAEALPKLNRMEYAVLQYIAERGYTGATDDELAIHFAAWAPETARARRVALWHKGLIRDSLGRRYTRRRRKAAVWVLAEREPTLFEGRGD